MGFVLSRDVPTRYGGSRPTRERVRRSSGFTEVYFVSEFDSMFNRVDPQ